MSRLIVIALLAANMLLLGFNASRQQPVPETPAQPGAGPARPSATDYPPIRLLSEMDPASAVVATRQCFTLGPWETEAGKDVVLPIVMDYAVSVQERTTEALMELGYWVALPAFFNPRDAGESVQALRKSGLQDLGVVTNEAGEYLVSLGYFLEEANARRRRDQVRELGFPAETRLQRETQPRYWLDYEQSAKEIPLVQVLAGLVPPEKHRAIRCS